MAATDKARSMVSQHRRAFQIIGVFLAIGGIVVVSGVIELPQFATFTNFVNDASIDVEKEDAGLLPFKTVGTGAEEVEYKVTIKNSGDITEDYRLAVKPNNGDGSATPFSVDVQGTGSQSLEPGELGSIMRTSLVTLEPGQSESWTVTVDTTDPESGDLYNLAMWGEVESGEKVTSTINKQVKIESGGGTLTATVVGTTMAIAGALMVLGV